MTKLLSESEVETYRQRGYHFPIEALSESEVAGFRKQLEDYEAASGGPIKGEMRHRSHVLFTWINEMIRHPKILDAMEDLLGPDILCWNTSFFHQGGRMIRASCPGIRTRPIGASTPPMSRPRGWRCRRPTRYPAA